MIINSRADFLRSMCESPHDLAIPLIYADWLDENGDADDQQTAAALRFFFQDFPAGVDKTYYSIPAVDADNMEIRGFPVMVYQDHADTVIPVRHGQDSPRHKCDWSQVYVGRNHYEMWLKHREQRLFERRCGLPSWDPDRKVTFSLFDGKKDTGSYTPLAQEVYGPLAWILTHLHPLFSYYPLRFVSPHDCIPMLWSRVGTLGSLGPFHGMESEQAKIILDAAAAGTLCFWAFSEMWYRGRESIDRRHLLPLELRPPHFSEHTHALYFPDELQAREWISKRLVDIGTGIMDGRIFTLKIM